MTQPPIAGRIGRIALILDERLSREKLALLTRTVNSVRQFAEIVLLSGNTDETQLLQKLEAQPFQLVLAPWYRYLAWSKVEAFYGLTRTSGPTFAGYFVEPLLPYEVGEQADHLRAIFLDFGNTSTSELHLLVKSLLIDKSRSGVLPLLRAGTSVYCENWMSGQGLGHRLDALMNLPELTSHEWRKRTQALRILIQAFWSLIYEEGPGKAEGPRQTVSKTPRAYFQLAADSNFLIARLCYTMQSWTSKDAIHLFWPDPSKPTSAAQLLIKYSDFLRVHHVADSYGVEIVAGLTQSAPSETTASSIHTLWVEPLAGNTFSEIPFTQPSASAAYLKPLPMPQISAGNTHPKKANDDVDAGERARERYVADVGAQIRELKAQLQEKEEHIRELRSGGVGTAPPLPPPDAESLLDAFQERYLEARFQIRQFEIQIHDLEVRKAQPQEIDALRKKMDWLAQREASWIKKLNKTLDHYRQVKAEKK